MQLDLICLAIAALFALAGAVRGVWGGLARAVASAAALIAAGLAAGPAGAWLTRGVKWPLPVGQTLMFVAVFFAVDLIVGGALLRLTRRLRLGQKSGLSRLVGAALGFGAGAVMAFVLATAAVFLAEPVPGFNEKWRVNTVDSAMASLARRYNPLIAFTWDLVPALRRVVRVAADPDVLALARDNAALGVLAQDPRVQALAKDRALRRAVAAGDDLAFLRRKEVLDLLSDPEVLAKLARTVGEQARLDALPPLPEVPRGK